ncbi:MAG: sigma-70 family RNA polymerase sigma factor [Deltaproteobacteria bacterium]|nr:sigma-70 family RNA polymerase sigma factor [Deltaproteobacteria bacterium]
MPRSHPPHLRAVETLPPPPAVGELEARARTGDVDAWSALYAQHYSTVFRQIRYLCGDRVLAEELAQETFAQAMTACRRYDGRRAFAGWMYGIALNVVRKHWRKHRNRSRAMERYEHLDIGRARVEDPDGSHLRRERSRVLYDVLDELPPRWREAFILREIQGLSTAEAAERLGISNANVAVRVTRARSRIRDELSRRGWLEENGAPA